MKFYTAYNRPASEPTEIGSSIYPIYEPRIDKKTGRKILIKVGEEDLYEKIQESLEGTKIENIVRRVTLGDPTALEQRIGQYLDLTEMPENLMAAQNFILKAEAEFEKLPLEIRKEFNYSTEEYVSAYGSEEWANRVGLTKVQEEIKEAATGVTADDQRNE
ncbi:minor capsid protein [Capybara microvirus Cap3_SP_481]|nr:minor capsid protein [Capybara microvirus Cap3_SP_481]